MLILEKFSDLQAYKGKDIGTTDWLQVTQEMIDKFAAASLDFQWIHLDVERAKTESPFGQTVAHGLLSLSLMPYFTYQLLKIENVKLFVNYGYNKIRFISPVLSGQKIRMSLTLKDIEQDNKGYKIYMDQIIHIEGVSKPACIAESVSLVVV